MTTIIRIRLKDGRTISGRADFAKGSPESHELPGSGRQVSGLRRVRHWSRAKTEQILALVRKLEELQDMRELTPRALRAPNR